MAAEKARAQALAGLHLVPEHMRGPVLGYIEHGNKVGGFLTALLNGSPHAFQHADPMNQAARDGWAKFLGEHAPRNCWGTSTKRQIWQDQRGLEGW